MGAFAYDTNVMILTYLLCLLGYQLVLLGVSACSLSLSRGFFEPDKLIQFASRYFTLEKG